jgi:raffinose/stachyose/melibiose transport system substrate-binding protein
MTKKNLPENNSIANKIGLFLALAFYIVSVIMVGINTSESSEIIDSDVKTITIAHWQLEDGFREGFDEAIKLYEELKAKKGEKVKIIQTTVPYRGYPQWFITQLISGDPSDIIELSGASRIHNQYFVPLSSYVARPNPYNKKTPLANIPWKDTYVDGMNSALDPIYAEYFGVGTCFHVTRVYVNKKLLKEATGSDKMPTIFNEWMEDCRKLREYGKRTGKPIIPIGVRGFDKATLNNLFNQYFSQLNGNLNDDSTKFCTANVTTYELLELIFKKKLDIQRLLTAVDLIQNIGKNFSEGFTATDLEQTKFLFFTGNVGFFPEGTWNAWSMVKNSPFEVEVINIPVIGPNNRYYRNFTGQISEMGVGVGGKFGITKASKHFDLALDFLHFLTSYKINQLTMMDYCKWPPAVIKAEYKGLLKKFKPIKGDAMRPVKLPFYLGRKSRTKMLEILERIIINDIDNPKKYFWNEFVSNLPFMTEEVKQSLDGGERQFFNIEGQRSCIAAGLLKNTLSTQKRKALNNRYSMGLENLVDCIRKQYSAKVGIEALERLQKEASLSEVSIQKEVK